MTNVLRLGSCLLRTNTPGRRPCSAIALTLSSRRMSSMTALPTLFEESEMSFPNFLAKAICFSDGRPKSDAALKRTSIVSSIMASATAGLQPAKSKPSWIPNMICASVKSLIRISASDWRISFQPLKALVYTKRHELTIAFCSVVLTAARVEADTNTFYAVQNFSCSYVSVAFEDERNFRRTMKPPPHPEALTTLETRELAQFVAGFLTAWNAISALHDQRDEPYSAYPPGLTVALHKIDAFCTLKKTKTIIDGIFDILTSPDANPIQKK
jgi:hypothetical protein